LQNRTYLCCIYRINSLIYWSVKRLRWLIQEAPKYVVIYRDEKNMCSTQHKNPSQTTGTVKLIFVWWSMSMIIITSILYSQTVPRLPIARSASPASCNTLFQERVTSFSRLCFSTATQNENDWVRMAAATVHPQRDPGPEGVRGNPFLIDWEENTFKGSSTVTWKPSWKKVENLVQSEVVVS